MDRKLLYCLLAAAALLVCSAGFVMGAPYGKLLASLARRSPPQAPQGTTYDISLPSLDGITVSGTITTGDRNTDITSLDVQSWDIVFKANCAPGITCTYTDTNANSSLSMWGVVQSGGALTLSSDGMFQLEDNADNCGARGSHCGSLIDSQVPYFDVYEAQVGCSRCYKGRGATTSRSATTPQPGIATLPKPAPEIDPASLPGGLALLLGGLIVLRGRRRA